MFLRIVTIELLLFLSVMSWSQQTVSLQDGKDSYAGCKDRTVCTGNDATRYLGTASNANYPALVSAHFRC